jgi:translation initiation factor eIF-2B subunit gamma
MDVHESLDVRTSLLWRYPRMNVTTTLQDAHIYIFKRWVLDLIVKNEKISSLRTDLLPVLAKMQWQSNLRKRQGIDECIPSQKAH